MQETDLHKSERVIQMTSNKSCSLNRQDLLTLHKMMLPITARSVPLLPNTHNLYLSIPFTITSLLPVDHPATMHSLVKWRLASDVRDQFRQCVVLSFCATIFEPDYTLVFFFFSLPVPPHLLQNASSITQLILKQLVDKSCPRSDD